jgi:ABC-type proline/glycine betaine transport system permease subunit
MTPGENDPLWRMRHALAGVGLATLASVFIAAGIGRWVGDWVGGGYGTRVAVYGALLAYVVAGAIALFMRVARHETAPLDLRRVLTWLASLWVWPALLLAGRRG